MIGLERGWLGLLMVIFWGGMVGLIVWAVRRATAKKPDSALTILQDRFARGEIDEQEYDARKAALLRR
jgi:putative membrane protein